jgi:hypothetical protein
VTAQELAQCRLIVDPRLGGTEIIKMLGKRHLVMRSPECHTALMSRSVRDIVLVSCALICAGTGIYVVYNVERFKRQYDLQFLGQPDPQNQAPPAAVPLK